MQMLNLTNGLEICAALTIQRLKISKLAHQNPFTQVKMSRYDAIIDGVHTLTFILCRIRGEQRIANYASDNPNCLKLKGC